MDTYGLITRIREYLSRIGKAHGFGIQSPWAFGFVTEVVGERLPYYAYADIDRKYESRRERQFQKLMLRVRNFVYPNQLVIVDDILTLSDERIGEIITEIGAKGAVVVRGIWRDSETLNRWKTLQQRDDVGITFDLYDFGICFLDTTIYKQHYRLNYL